MSDSRTVMTPSTSRAVAAVSACLGFAISLAAAGGILQRGSGPISTDATALARWMIAGEALGRLGSVPTVVLAVFWYGLVLLLYVVTRRAPRSELAYCRCCFALSLMPMAIAATWLLKATGQGALYRAAAVAVLAPAVAIFVAGALAQTELVSPGASGRSLAARLRSPWPLAATGAYLALAAVGIVSLHRIAAPASRWGDLDTPAGRAAFLQWFATHRRVVDPSLPAEAQVTVVTFNDYQCPPCRRHHQELRPLIDRYRAAPPGQVRFVTRDFPLAARCNTYARVDVHPAACDAAVAARIARKAQKLGLFEQWLFDHQEALSADTILAATERFGFRAEFVEEFEATLALVRAEADWAGLTGVDGTPTVQVNGVRLPEPSVRAIELAIEHELGRRHVQLTDRGSVAP
jgi:protein-disulfide isomerase